MDKRAKVTRGDDVELLNVMGCEVRFLCPANTTGKAWSAMEAVLPRGAGPPLHDHDWDEGYYVVAGEVRFTLGKDTLTARAGDFLYAPGGVPHAFEGTSEAPSRLLIVDIPSAAEAFFRDVDREVKDFPAEAAKIPEIGLRHGLRFRH